MNTNDGQLKFAVESFLAAQSDGLISISRVVNQLLALWASAHEMGAAVAAPLEVLLAASTQRNLITKDELRQVLDEVLAAASQPQVVAGTV
jgi:hypothetical protein